MQIDKHIFRILNAGQMSWFEADEITLSEIKTRYALQANDFLYFRKGEDWLKYLIDTILAVASGPEQMLNLANACSAEVLEFTNTIIKNAQELSVIDWFDWYLRVSGGIELSRRALRFLKKHVFHSLITRENRPIVKDFRILCKNSQENIDHLPLWKAMGTKVRFYKEDADAGSHRFYISDMDMLSSGDKVKAIDYAFMDSKALSLL